MAAASEAGEVFALLEGGAAGAREAADALAALFGSVREPWLARGLLGYHERTGSARALDLLARAPEPHARYLLDALLERLRGVDRARRQHALRALASLVARRPAWPPRLPPHAPALARELARAARLERDAPPLVHALLALAALLPAAPATAHHLWPELADALLRPPALDPPPPRRARPHLRLAQLALFRALYATHPCTLLDALRAALAAAPPAARDACERDLDALARSVRLHPGLLIGSRAREADAARWARVEPHDVVAETRRLSLPERDEPTPPPDASAPAPAPAPPPPPLATPAEPAPGSGAHAARAAAALRPGAEPWFPLADRCGADSAPHTPLPAEPDGAEPPETAVEATPENTPAEETRARFRFPSESGAVRAIGRRSRPASPPRKETSPPAGPGASGAAEGFSARVSRVVAERRAVESPVPMAGAPPGAGARVARPEPRGAGAAGAAEEPLDVEDREVLELTERERDDDAWSEAEGGAPSAVLRDPRADWARPDGPAGPHRILARPASCPPRAAGRAVDAAVQTIEVFPEPYEFLIADFYRDLPDDPRRQGDGGDGAQPCERLDAYLAELYAGGGPPRPRSELAEQLALVHAQLMYERWRREAHAERSRRLLGRCRQARGSELRAAALRERVRAVARERDELRARLLRAVAGSPPPAPHGEPRARLEAALLEERAARARAEAALREAEAQRAADAAELRRSRGESFEAARHVEALARAALAAERRAEHVRRLRRELLVLAEREARLGPRAAPAGCAGACGAEERAARAAAAAAARAEAEAAEGAVRAEAALARAHELEATLALRDAALADLKRTARRAAEEHAVQLSAAQDKYRALMSIVRVVETHRLERLATGAEEESAEDPPPEADGSAKPPEADGSAKPAAAPIATPAAAQTAAPAAEPPAKPNATPATEPAADSAEPPTVKPNATSAAEPATPPAAAPLG